MRHPEWKDIDDFEQISVWTARYYAVPECPMCNGEGRKTGRLLDGSIATVTCRCVYSTAPAKRKVKR